MFTWVLAYIGCMDGCLQSWFCLGYLCTVMRSLIEQPAHLPQLKSVRLP